MQFNSYSYLLLLGPMVVVYWALPTAQARRLFLLLASVVFYASWGMTFAPLPFLLCGMVYFCGRRLMASGANEKSRWMWRGIGLTLAVLVFFKYRDFALENLNAALTALGQDPVQFAWRLALPLGISFYSFEAISYLIDTRQGRVKDVRFLDLTLFVTFFPHLIAGPIVRVRELVPQFGQFKKFEIPMLVKGLDRLLWGLVQKNLFANNLAPWVDEGFLPLVARTNSTIDNWALAVAFGLQVYFDFAAYSNMAIGTAQLLGITLPENFRHPYHAANPSDFWQRWHMTLSRWIRDYLFFPINAKYAGAPIPLYISLVAIMAVVGLWHGAGWGFILWGAMHGVYLVIYRMSEHRGEKRGVKPGSTLAGRWAWRLFTLAAVMAAWVPFRASSLEQTLTMLGSMVFRWSFHVSYSVNLYLVVGAVSVFCMLEPWLAERMEALEKRVSGKAVDAVLLWWRPILYAAGLLLFLIFDDRDMQFIYFQF